MAEYIVFCDGPTGMEHIPQLGGTTLAETVQNITEGCADYRYPSKLWMYYIYKADEKQIPLFGTKFDVYRYSKAVAGSGVSDCFKKHDNLKYALTHQSQMTWLFTDNIFGD